MKILQVHKFYHVNGGASRYFFEASRLLEGEGHIVVPFSMEDKKNKETRWSKYFVSNVSYNKIVTKDSLFRFARFVYSHEAKEKIIRLIRKFLPDIVHLHSIYHHLSPSIILELKKRKIPMVQTLHDYHLISPNYNLFHQGKICEITKPDKFYKAISHKCVKNLYLASLVEVVEKYIHYWLGWERNYIDYFIAPSQFMKNKLIEYGLPKNKIIHLPHFIDTSQYKPNYTLGDYILYFGRLSSEKGLNVLLKAMKYLPKINLKIAGRGNIEYEAKLKIQSLDLKNVEFVGFLQNNELKNCIAKSRFTILPSSWYEVFGLSILESYACGKPVVAADIGGIPEVIKNEYTGLLFKSGNLHDCKEKIDYLWKNKSICRKWGTNAREHVENCYGPDKHYKQLMDLYKKIIHKAKTRR